MNKQSSNSIVKSTKRIVNDLAELHRNPLEGIQVYLPDDHVDFFTLHCDITPQSNVYQGIRLHTVMRLPHDYPLNSPSMHLSQEWYSAPLPFRFHSHLIGTSICNNILSNFSSHFDKFETGSGWSPGCTLSTVMVQMLDFFSSDDPDHFAKGARCTYLDQKQVDLFAERSKTLRCPTCVRKTKYVPEGAVAGASVSFKSEKMAAELICSLTKNTYQTDSGIIFGYPLLVEKDKFERLWPSVLLELLSYEGYMFGIQGSGFDKLERFAQVKMISANKNLFNFWIAIYINDDHYRRARQTILNSVSVILKGGISGVAANDFTPSMILSVLPNLINKTTVNILKIQQSSTILQAYCHFVRLYVKLLQDFPELKLTLQRTIDDFVREPMKRNKKAIGDLGEFIINFFVVQHDQEPGALHSYEDIKLILFKEFMARQIHWIEKKLGKRITNFQKLSATNLVTKIFHQPELGKESCVIAYILLLFNINSAKTFINKQALERIDKNYGYLSDEELDKFKVTLKTITSVDNHRDFLTHANLADVVSSDQEMADILYDARGEALKQGYIRF